MSHSTWEASPHCWWMHRQVSHDAAEGEGVGPWARRHSACACILACLQQPFWGVRISNGRIRRAEHPRGATQRLKSNFQGFAAVRWLAMHACICARVHAPAQRVHACTCDPSAAFTCVLHAPPSAATRWCHHCGIIGGPSRGCISLGHTLYPSSWKDLLGSLSGRTHHWTDTARFFLNTGSSYTGQATGLSKVQYIAGDCNVMSQVRPGHCIEQNVLAQPVMD